METSIIAVLIMKIDLHSHTYYSDGVLSPYDLVQRALAQELNVLAVTDHDTILGVAPALEAAQAHALKIIPGIEMSCEWKGQTIHMLGLNINLNHALFSKKLEEMMNLRQDRAHQISKKLLKFGIPGIEEGLARQVKGVPGRLHFARYLAEKGYASTPGKAFRQFMARGKPGYVPVQWVSLQEAAELIQQAGGIPVIAHPRRYDLSLKRLTIMLQEFKEAGGVGIEVANSNQNKSDQLLLLNLARQLNLAISIGSDFHEPCAYNELGKARFLLPLEGYQFVSDLL